MQIINRAIKTFFLVMQLEIRLQRSESGKLYVILFNLYIFFQICSQINDRPLLENSNLVIINFFRLQRGFIFYVFCGLVIFYVNRITMQME